MLVEDEELILMGIKSIVDWDRLGLELVHMAHDGLEALKLWEERPVDIIVSDIDMPGMNGLELLKEIRKRDDRVRCIILTGYDRFEYAQKAISLDIENYILKPIDEEELEKQLILATKKLEELEKQKIM